MTIAIKHAFTSLKGDGTDATQVQPSNWNAAHATSMASGNIIGRLSAGVGTFEEIPISAYMAGLLAAADQTTLAGMLGLFDSGDVKYTFKSTAPSGWILIPGGVTASTIGNAASGANLRANADCQNLFVVLYNSMSDAIAPVSGGRTGNALNDFNANKTITIPALAGRAPIGAGAATGTTSQRILGGASGEETHLLVTSEIPSHVHPNTLTDPGHFHQYQITVAGTTILAGGQSASAFLNTTTNTAQAVTGITINNAAQGGGGAHNNMQPFIVLSVMVKL